MLVFEASANCTNSLRALHARDESACDRLGLALLPDPPLLLPNEEYAARPAPVLAERSPSTCGVHLAMWPMILRTIAALRRKHKAASSPGPWLRFHHSQGFG
jgi:predicted component of type VI protein secretion system